MVERDFFYNFGAFGYGVGLMGAMGKLLKTLWLDFVTFIMKLRR
jgi:hypothetical protein